jgi:hypothetical protein
MIRALSVERIKVIVMVSALLCANFILSAAELKHFDPSIFGRRASESIKLLIDDSGEIYPSLIQVDLKKGKYYAATVTYSTDMTLDEARRSLNKLYSRWQKPNFAKEPTMGLWRNEEQGFSIQLTREKDEVVVRYVSWRDDSKAKTRS